jgi:hypothetical protein
MIKFNPEDKDELSFHEIFEQALKINTKEEAASYLADYSKWIKIKSFGKEQVKEPEDIIRENFGYYAGYYSHDVRRKIERLFECEHPIFGSIEKNGPPTMQQAFALGLEMGAKIRDEKAQSKIEESFLTGIKIASKDEEKNQNK